MHSLFLLLLPKNRLLYGRRRSPSASGRQFPKLQVPLEIRSSPRLLCTIRDLERGAPLRLLTSLSARSSVHRAFPVGLQPCFLRPAHRVPSELDTCSRCLPSDLPPVARRLPPSHNASCPRVCRDPSTPLASGSRLPGPPQDPKPHSSCSQNLLLTVLFIRGIITFNS